MSPSIATDQVRVWGGIRIIAILPGPGKVVLTTFHHSSSDLIDLYLSPQPPTGVNSPSSTHLTSTSSSLTGQLTTLQTSEEALLYPRASRATSIDPSWERIGVTGNHPIWSQDRHGYVAAMDLRLGERLKNLSGDTVWVQQKLPRPGPTPVYNLAVQDEHVYYVGARGVLAHNVDIQCFRDSNGRLRNANGTFAPDGGRSMRARSGRHGNSDANTDAQYNYIIRNPDGMARKTSIGAQGDNYYRLRSQLGPGDTFEIADLHPSQPDARHLPKSVSRS